MMGTQDTLIEDMGMAAVDLWVGGRFRTHNMGYGCAAEGSS
jgi:hypothetical protein